MATSPVLGGRDTPTPLTSTSPSPTLKPSRILSSAAISNPRRRGDAFRAKDPWLLATFLVSCIASVASLLYFFLNHQILLNNDAYSHLLIARRLFDSATPGIAQLGGVWLPLPHLVMVPFVWNDYLWRTGLAGSIPSMLAFIVSSIYLFLSARRLTHSGSASLVGTLLFILNPNMLYLQTTPLSEPVLIATLIMASYYFLAWAQEDSLKYLILAAACTFLATMARYDGWALFVVFLALIGPIGWLKHHSRALVEGNFLLFSVLAGLGIVLWLIWCEAIFGDPLYFARRLVFIRGAAGEHPSNASALHLS